VAGTPMASHFHNLPVPSGTINAQSFAGIASSSLPPYLTVYMWARTS
jgi:hypothetical protein